MKKKIFEAVYNSLTFMAGFMVAAYTICMWLNDYLSDGVLTAIAIAGGTLFMFLGMIVKEYVAVWKEKIDERKRREVYIQSIIDEYVKYHDLLISVEEK